MCDALPCKTHPFTGPAHIGPYWALEIGPYFGQYGKYGQFHIWKGLEIADHKKIWRCRTGRSMTANCVAHTCPRRHFKQVKAATGRRGQQGVTAEPATRHCRRLMPPAPAACRVSAGMSGPRASEAMRDALAKYRDSPFFIPANRPRGAAHLNGRTVRRGASGTVR
jgi:hypothetical protein